MTAPRPIAVFDFDGTLVKGDSLWPFLSAVAGWPRCVAALAMAVVRQAMERPQGRDARTFIKAHLLQSILGGRRVDDLAPAVEKMRGWPKWNEAILEKLKEHHDAGNHVVIASGSLDIYLTALLEKVPYDALICTRMEIEDSVVTGEMISGNCVRRRKAELVADYLITHGPFGESWGYGNAPHDLPMMNLLQHRVVV